MNIFFIAGARVPGRWLLVMAAASIVACAGEGRQATPDGLQDAMDGFVAALQSNDPATVAQYFPQQGKWTLLSTIGGPEASSQHSRAEVQQALRTRTGLYDSLVESEGDGDSLRDYVQLNGGRPWRATGPRQFAPEEVFDDPQHLFIRWQQEQGRWVIDTIGVPLS